MLQHVTSLKYSISEAVHNLIMSLFATPTQYKSIITSALCFAVIEIINKNQTATYNIFKKQ